MDKKIQNKTNYDNMINKILNELSENKIIDIKAVKTQLDRLYASKYNSGILLLHPPYQSFLDGNVDHTVSSINTSAGSYTPTDDI